MDRDGFKCLWCHEKTESPLNVHHLIYARNPWDVPDDMLITLCEGHHGDFEKAKKDITRSVSSLVAMCAFVFFRDCLTRCQTEQAIRDFAGALLRIRDSHPKPE
jgi:hypothetical protein